MKTEDMPVSLVGSMRGRYLRVVTYSTKNPGMSIVVCPHCGSLLRYQSAQVYFGKTGCPKCFDVLRLEIDAARKANPRGWENADWEPFGTDESEETKLGRKRL